MKKEPREEKPHWRKKKLFSFTEEDEIRFERLLARADEVSPGINQSQLLRVALLHLERSPMDDFAQAIAQASVPRMGFEPKTKEKHDKYELSDAERQEIIEELKIGSDASG